MTKKVNVWYLLIDSVGITLMGIAVVLIPMPKFIAFILLLLYLLIMFSLTIANQNVDDSK